MAYEYRHGEQIIFLVLVFSCLAAAGNGKFLERFCKISCNRGRGGNLCGCNGFHFAGKRTSYSDISEIPSSNSQKNYLNDLSDIENNGAYDVENLEKTPYRQKVLLPVSDELPLEPKRLENVRVFIRWLLHKLDESRSANRQGYKFDEGSDALTNGRNQ
ncbi:uncharacterized protein LOC110447962 [Mizuhopecten yessoensis]|uniref:Uncharacterized protein n=1 Tax=Mizuhopecten yessoensis TaxID=6573 RepID=A0A210QU73_MIZYE|nr:uncharacterized protein LOC110447962 [Mizuhopecten yessoensis]OWF52284.1 hypothetical protein KP79_PYT04123 [Mizuhopecten yessoensis]